MSARANISIFVVVVWGAAVGGSYGIGGLGPAVATVIVGPLILIPIARAYMNAQSSRVGGGGSGSMARDTRTPQRQLLVASALLALAGLAAALTTSGATRTAIVALALGAAAWGVGLAWFFGRGARPG